jgi:hypothetical protein
MGTYHKFSLVRDTGQFSGTYHKLTPRLAGIKVRAARALYVHIPQANTKTGRY